MRKNGPKVHPKHQKWFTSVKVMGGRGRRQIQSQQICDSVRKVLLSIVFLLIHSSSFAAPKRRALPHGWCVFHTAGLRTITAARIAPSIAALLRYVSINPLSLTPGELALSCFLAPLQSREHHVDIGMQYLSMSLVKYHDTGILYCIDSFA